MVDQPNLAELTTLEHLMVVPRGGLGNMLRAVGAGKQLCSLTGAKLTVVWEYGNYGALIAADPDVEVLDRVARVRRSPFRSRCGHAHSFR